MRTHDLKCWPEPFQAILDGRKRYEIRVDDRGFAVGDELWLKEWHPGSGSLWVDFSPESKVIAPHYTGRDLRVRVLYLTPGGAWGLPSNMCVMSIDTSPAVREQVGWV